MKDKDKEKSLRRKEAWRFFKELGTSPISALASGSPPSRKKYEIETEDKIKHSSISNRSQ